MQFVWITKIFFLFFSSDLAVARKTAEFNYLDCGKTIVCTHFFVIPPEFKKAGHFSEGLASVQLKDTILMDEVTLATLMEGVTLMKGVTLAAEISVPLLGEIISKINLSGDVKIPELNPWRYIDKQKNFSERKFMSAGPFNEGLARAITLFFPSPHPKSFKMGYIDKSMQFVFTIDTEKFQIIRDFSEGLAAAKREDKWGYIDKTPQWVFRPIYDKVGDFNEGLAWVKLNGKYGYISKKTKKFFIEPKFDGTGDFSEGLAPVKVDDEWGYISKETKGFFIPPEFAFAGKFTEGLAPVLKNEGRFSDDKWGYINKEKEFAIRAKFDGVGNFREGLAIVAKKKDAEVKYGYINKVGRIVVPLKFDGAGNFSEGFAAVKQGDKWGYIEVVAQEIE